MAEGVKAVWAILPVTVPLKKMSLSLLRTLQGCVESHELARMGSLPQPLTAYTFSGRGRDVSSSSHNNADGCSAMPESQLMRARECSSLAISRRLFSRLNLFSPCLLSHEFVCFETGFLCSFGACPWTPSVDHVGLELSRDPPVSAS